MQPFLLYAVIFLALAGAAAVILTGGNSQLDSRVGKLGSKKAGTPAAPARAVAIEAAKDGRRKQIQDTLRDIENKNQKAKKRITIADRLDQAGLEVDIKVFWIASAVLGAILAVIPLLAGTPLIVGGLAGLVGFLGLPRWILNKLVERRREKFLTDLADAIEIMVRSLKSGLPVNDALAIIASELGPPVGPEFLEVVEGQKIGLTIPAGFERMFERVPLAEVNFLAIVINIQSKTGGNLSEALGNLARVLRERKRMKAKIKSVSQEVRTSAKIIGGLPFVITGGIAITNPEFLHPLFSTNLGHIILVAASIYMLIGLIIMRQMIRIDI